MGFFDQLPVLGDVAAARAGKPIPKGPSRFAVAEQDEKREKAEQARWKREIWIRDGNRDRLTKRKVRKAVDVHPLRGECHHIVGRADKAVRWDRRNGILLSAETHGRVERNELKIVGTKFFVVNGKKYIDGDAPVRFVKP